MLQLSDGNNHNVLLRPIYRDDLSNLSDMFGVRNHGQVEAGADLGAFNKDGFTALDVASSRNHLVIECYLRTEGAFSSLEFWGAADSG